LRWEGKAVRGLERVGLAHMQEPWTFADEMSM
jgi:hypothetical protein